MKNVDMRFIVCSCVALSALLGYTVGCGKSGSTWTYSDKHLSATLPDSWQLGPRDKKGRGLMFVPKRWHREGILPPIGVHWAAITESRSGEDIASDWMANIARDSDTVATREPLRVAGKNVESVRHAMRGLGDTVYRSAPIVGKRFVYMVVVNERPDVPVSEVQAILDSLEFKQ